MGRGGKTLAMDLRDEWLFAGREFTQPDWSRIDAWVRGQTGDLAEQDAIWMAIARSWISALCKEFGEAYRVDESEHFMLVSVASDAKADELLRFLERTLVDIREALPCLVGDPPAGKCPVLVVADHDRFYAYLADFTGSDELITIGGVFLNRGWGHFALPSHDLRLYEDTFAHELCHALVSRLRLPLWLDEAIAVTVENSITRRNPYILDREMVERHQGYWTAAHIQAFWTGESFGFADDGHELSYHLAQFILNAIYQGGATPPDLINEFILQAGGSDDAGASAAREVLGFELGELLEHFLGEGDWDPVPSRS